MVNGKAGDGDIRARRRLAPTQTAAQGVGGVMHQHQIVTVGDVAELVPVAYPSHQVGHQHGAGVPRDDILHGVLQDLVVAKPHIHKHRLAADLVNAGHIGGEGQRRGDDFGPRGQVQQTHRNQQGG